MKNGFKFDKNIIKKVNNNKQSIIEYFILLIIVMLYFSVDWNLEYATDTYAIYMGDWSRVVHDFTFRSGRPVIAFFFAVLFEFQLSLNCIYFISFTLGIICLTCSMYIYRTLLSKVITSAFSRLLCTTAVYISPFFIEYFMFLEKGMFCFAILLCTMSAYFFIKFLQTEKLVFEVISLLFLVIEAFTYQAIAAFSIVLILPFVYYYKRTIKQIIVNLFFALANFGSVGLLSFIFLKFVGLSNRTESVSITLDHLINMGKQIIRIFISTMDILPKYLYALLCFAVFVVLIVNIVYMKKDVLLKSLYLIMQLMLIIFCATVTCILGVSGTAPRVVFPLGTCAASMLVFFELNIRDKEDWFYYIEKILQIFFCLFLVIELFSFQKIIIDKNKVAAIDEYRINMIGEQIDKYEDNSNKRIEYITFYKEDMDMNQYPDLFYSGDLVVSAFSTDWSDLAAFNYFLDANYQKGVPEDEIKEQFKNIEDYGIRTKLIFDNNTLHLYIY